MQVDVVQAGDLGPRDREQWSSWQRSDCTLRSPYFTPEFTQLLGEVKKQVRVGVLRDGAHAVGYFPFERRFGGVGVPAGAPLSDYQGVVHGDGAALSFDARELVHACGLHAIEFDHMVASQAPFAPYFRAERTSPTMDLSGGWESYVEACRRRSKGLISNARRKARKLAAEVGPLRFVYDERDPRVLSQLLQWKSAQYRRTGCLDLFHMRWPVALLDRIFAVRAPDFAGVLSVLFAGDAPVAAHFGMRTRTLLHYWFPSYDMSFARYSPGLTLLLEMAEAAAGAGIEEIDLGKGDESYKSRLQTGATSVGEGAVELASVTTSVRRAWRDARAWLRDSRLRPLVRPLAPLGRWSWGRD